VFGIPITPNAVTNARPGSERAVQPRLAGVRSWKTQIYGSVVENTNTIQFRLASAGASMPAVEPSRDFPHFSPAMGRAATLASIDNAFADARDDAEAKRCIGREG